MLSARFGIEVLVREPTDFRDREAPGEPERLVRSVRQPNVVGSVPVSAVPTRHKRARATSPDDVEAA